MLDVKKIVEQFAMATDWRVGENANMGYYYLNLLMNTAGASIAKYTLDHVYGGNFLGRTGKPLDITEMHNRGQIHIHDLGGGIAPYCFTADTKISLLDGREVPIKDLVGLDEFWVYSCKEDGTVVPGRGHSCRKTRENVKIVNVILDNGESVRCTPDHPFMLRDGSYKAASNLTSGDSLMPLYRTVEGGYEKVLNNKTGKYIFTHWMVARNNLDITEYNNPEEESQIVVHHADFNKRNNSPNNLKRWGKHYHWSYHSEITRKRLVEDTDFRSKTISRLLLYASENGKHSRYKINTLLAGSPEEVSRRNIEAAKNGTHPFQLDSTREISSITNYRRFADGSHPFLRQDVKHKNKAATITRNKSVELRKLNSDRVRSRNTDPAPGPCPYCGREYEKYCSYISHTSQCHSNPNRVLWNYNHKVVLVEDAGYADVYDFTVDEYHNFALTAGIFQHNCGGWSLQNLLDIGFDGGEHHPVSGAAKHFRSACNHMVNFIGVMSNEYMGAQAFSDVDLFLSPLMLKDWVYFCEATSDPKEAYNLWIKDIQQSIQEVLFSVNLPSRWGGQCVSAETECLTVSGWKVYDQLTVGELIYTFNMDTHNLELKPLQRVNVYDYDDNMVELTNGLGTASQLVTPNHRVVRKLNNSTYNNKTGKCKYVFEDAADLVDYSRPLLLTAAPVIDRCGVDMSDDEIRLLAWVLSDANMEKDKNRIGIYQSKEQYVSEIRDLLNRLCVPFTETIHDDQDDNWDKDRKLNDVRLPNYQFSIYGEWAIKYRTYTNGIRNAIPQEFKDRATKEQIDIFIDEYIKADGNGGSAENRKKIYKKYQQMVDDLQEILTIAGYATNVRKQESGVNIIVIYEVPVKEISVIKEVPYNGKVWCPTTENGTFVARRDGFTFITGNSPFSNFSFALAIPDDMKGMPIGLKFDDKVYAAINQLPRVGVPFDPPPFGDDITYDHMLPIMYLFIEEFFSIYNKGDYNNKPFTFPVITVNLNNDFFELPSVTLITILNSIAKYGTCYFMNCVNGEISEKKLDPTAARSMCCRLQLDLEELKVHTGGLFGAGSSTGSIGVCTINMPEIGYIAGHSNNHDKKAILFSILEEWMNIAREAHKRKREVVLELYDRGMFPYTRRYLPNRFRTYFSTFGYIGLHECCLNYGIDDGIMSDEGIELSKQILRFMSSQIKKYQVEDGCLYNLEAVPAEGASYRMARKSKDRLPDIVTSGTDEAPYFTNSCHMPVDHQGNLLDMIDHQNQLQRLHSGGTVVHLYIGEKLDAGGVMAVIKLMSTTTIPYFTITPVFSICPVHGYISGSHPYCPYDHSPDQLEKYGTICGCQHG